MPADEEFNRRMQIVEKAIDQHGTYLLHYLNSLTKHWQDAEDLQSELWVVVLHQFAEADMMHVGLLRRKAFQVFVDFWRKKRQSLVFTVDELPEVAAPKTSVEPYTDAEEERFKILFFAEYPVGLNQEQKDALYLHARFGYTHKEIAEHLGRPASTIGDWLQHARQAFADYLNNTNFTKKRYELTARS
ncbi:MAG: RNA polymerase sigma factor [Akkermansiaceae bacterium]